MTATIASPTLSPKALHDAHLDGEELALIDVREQGVYFNGHLFWAVCIPVSRLELMVLDLVPRLSTRIVLCDDGAVGLTAIAATVLAGMGYSDVSVLEGGTAGWADAGYELYSGVNVPSKAFGEFVEHAYDTPRVPAEELNDIIQSGRDMVILDSRPMDEFTRMSIPGGIDVPGAELVYRVHDIAPDPETLVVVNCAGRTRSIIGSQSLINAGIPNQVVALKDGTMGWELAGFSCDHGKTAFGPDPSPEALALAQQRAAGVAERFGVSFADKATVEQWQAEAEKRTLYLLDVRTAEEYAAGHVAGSRHAPGGQLVQGTDEFVGTRHARIVLFDDEQVRAVMTASWLVQLGWHDVHVYRGGIGDWPVETGGRLSRAPEIGCSKTISPGEIDPAADFILDLSDSLTYRSGHIPGAWWGVRSRLGEIDWPSGKRAVLYADDDRLAHLGAATAAGLDADRQIVVLEGGVGAWRDAGHAAESDDGSMQRATTETNDVWYKPYDFKDKIRAKMEEYLVWEVALVDQIARDDTVSFRKYD